MNLGALRQKSAAAPVAVAPLAAVDAAPAPQAPAPQAPRPGATLLDTDLATYAGELGSTMATLAFSASIKKSNLRPNDPDSRALERVEKSIARQLERRWGNREIPWWLEMGLAGSGLYLSMRIGAEPARRELTPDAATPPPAPPAPPAAGIRAPKPQIGVDGEQ